MRQQKGITDFKFFSIRCRLRCNTLSHLPVNSPVLPFSPCCPSPSSLPKITLHSVKKKLPRSHFHTYRTFLREISCKIYDVFPLIIYLSDFIRVITGMRQEGKREGKEDVQGRKGSMPGVGWGKGRHAERGGSGREACQGRGGKGWSEGGMQGGIMLGPSVCRVTGGE